MQLQACESGFRRNHCGERELVPRDGTEVDLLNMSVHRAMRAAPHLEPHTFRIDLHPPSHMIVMAGEYTSAEAQGVSIGQAAPSNSAGSRQRCRAVWDRELGVSHPEASCHGARVPSQPDADIQAAGGAPATVEFFATGSQWKCLKSQLEGSCPS